MMLLVRSPATVRAPIARVARLGRLTLHPQRWLSAQPPPSCRSVPRLVAAGGLLAGLAGAQAYGAGPAECQPTAAIGVPPVAGVPAPLSPGGEFQKPRVLCLHGINLNMFGKRDAATYGTATLADIDGRMAALAAELGVELESFQTNHEGEMAERIHRAHVLKECDVVVINAGAWTHYSYGLRDALAILTVPVIEVHMSNIHAREDMAGSTGEQIRHHSVVSPLAYGIVAGFGVESYLLGLRAAVGLAKAARAAMQKAMPARQKSNPKTRSPFGSLD